MLGSRRGGASVLVSLVAAALLAGFPSAQQSTPKKIKHVDPVYPEQAQRMRVQGAVIVEITVGTDGRVTNARVLRSIPLLDQAALDAVKGWVYDASGLGAPVRMTVTVPFGVSVPAVQPAAPPRPASADAATPRAVQAPSQRAGQGAAPDPSRTERAPAPNRPAAAGASPSDDSFNTNGLRNEPALRAIYRGQFAPSIVDRNGSLLPALMQGYLNAFARRCSAYLAPNKVEMKTTRCATWEVTKNGLGMETNKTCVEWNDNVPTRLFADPELYAARKQLDRPERAAEALAALMTSSNPIRTGMDFAAMFRSAEDDTVRLLEMNACDGPGLKRFAENLRRLALNLTPLKLDGDHAFYLEDLQRSRDPERFAHYLLWNMTPYGQTVRKPDESFEAGYAAARETFNALAKVHGRDKMIAAAQRILSAPKLRHGSGSDLLANPAALGCVESNLKPCYWELVPFLPRPGAPAHAIASSADRLKLLAACEPWATDQAAKGRGMYSALKPYCDCAVRHFVVAADVAALIADFGPAFDRLRGEPRYASMKESCRLQ